MIKKSTAAVLISLYFGDIIFCFLGAFFWNAPILIIQGLWKIICQAFSFLQIKEPDESDQWPLQDPEWNYWLSPWGNPL